MVVELPCLKEVGTKGVFVAITVVTLPWREGFLGRGGLRGHLGGGSWCLRLPWSRECLRAGGWLCHGVSQKLVPGLRCHCHSKLGGPHTRYISGSWQTCFMENSGTLVWQDLEVGEKIVLGLTDAKWLHGEKSKLGNLKQGMKLCKLSLSAGVFLCLGCKTRRMVLVSWWQWEKVLGPQRWQDRHVPAMGG